MRAARVAYQRDYYDRFDRAARGHRPLTDADHVRAHLRTLLELGWSMDRIGREAGVAAATVRRCLVMPDVRVRAVVAERILAVRPRATVTTVGLTRRVRALCALGWSTAVIAEHAGLHVDTIKEYRRGERIDAHKSRPAILAAFRELSMRTPAPVTRAQRSAVSSVRNDAQRAGWAPPLAWDDDTIDDPAATPDVGAPARHLDLDEWARLVRHGEHPTRAATRCGVTTSAVERAAHRQERRDVLDLIAGARHAERTAS